jgi:hypothetical protein
LYASHQFFFFPVIHSNTSQTISAGPQPFLSRDYTGATIMGQLPDAEEDALEAGKDLAWAQGWAN